MTANEVADLVRRTKEREREINLRCIAAMNRINAERRARRKP
jgi:hypothetical protein